MSRSCAVDGCDRAHNARGFCTVHYARWRRHGDPLTILRPTVRHGDDEASRKASIANAKRRWRLANPEKMKAARVEWEAKNPETRRAYRRARKKADPVANRANVQRRKARMRNVPTVPFTAEQARQRWAFFGGLRWMCGGSAHALDHVKPIAAGGAHALCNLRPACTVCNSRKGAKWPFRYSSRGAADAPVGKPPANG